MKPWTACAIIIMTACNHPPPAAPRPSPSAAQPSPSAAQPSPSAPTPPPAAAKPQQVTGTPRLLAAIDVFGSKRVSSADIIAASGLEPGGTVVFPSQELAEKLEAATQRLKERFHFAFVEVSPISYFGASPEAGKVFITIDVVDPEDADRLKFAPEPSKDVPDPEGLIAAWLDYDTAVWALQRSGALKPPFTCKGGMHCALGFNHPDLAPREDVFIEKAPGHVAELIAVLRGDKDHKRRAAAAFVLAYAKDRKQVIDALLPSIDDPSAGVRNNAMRVLVMIQNHADTAVVPLDAALHAMRFPTTTDRNKAAYLLAGIAKRTSTADRARIARELGDLLVVMVAMKQPNNRDPALDILKAISGEDHGTDAAAWRAWLERQR